MLDTKSKKDVLSRLNRIKGQIAGVQRMVEEPRYCVDIINQITAIKRALDQVGLIVMKQHINTCVSSEIKKGHDTQKVNELIQTIDQFVR
ncbi:MAG: metal-sensitive transcriptional regulator [Planctomycetes bacterium]|nr:metal-sensitive transcriptional regulator [Planctomycetota bacterium]